MSMVHLSNFFINRFTDSMSLQQVYSNQVQSKALNGFSSFSFGSLIERDPSIQNLERNVMEKFKEINPPENPVKSLEKIQSLSVEDAIKELIEISKK